MNYAYGASFNCQVGNNDVGGGGEGCTSLDYLSNDLGRLGARLIADSTDAKYKIVMHHELIGSSANIGGMVVAVMVTDDEDESVTAVLFHEPDGSPVIVE